MKVGCQTVSYTAVRHAMAQQVSVWKAKQASCSAHQKTVAALQTACDNLTAKHDEWKARQVQLRTTIETLRAREAALAATTETPESGLVAELDRATELASKVERRLRIAEREQALGNASPIDQALNAGELDGPSVDANVEADVDAILGDTAVAGR